MRFCYANVQRMDMLNIGRANIPEVTHEAFSGGSEVLSDAPHIARPKQKDVSHEAWLPRPPSTFYIP